MPHTIQYGPQAYRRGDSLPPIRVRIPELSPNNSDSPLTVSDVQRADLELVAGDTGDVRLQARLDTVDDDGDDADWQFERDFHSGDLDIPPRIYDLRVRLRFANGVITAPTNGNATLSVHD